MPDLSRINIKRGSRVEAIVKNLTSMSRSINSALQDAGGDSGPIGGVGSLEKEQGERRCSKRVPTSTTRCSRRSRSTPIPAESLAICPSYPAMMDELSLADGEMLRSVDAARASLTQLDQSLGDLDEFFKELDHSSMSYNGDIESERLRPRSTPA